jgi:hypothetical protein
VPNLPAAVDARGRSACYPRSTFYLLSDGPSMQDRRITNADFRPCSTDGSRSQAPLYVYARVARLPTGPRVPWRSSVTLWEETAPVKLPDEHGPSPGYGPVRTNDDAGWYFTDGSRTAGAAPSQPPTYATQDGRPASANLQ